MSVVIFHGFPDTLRSGFVGVDIFFVISGFLITSIILNHLENGRFSFATFYARRIRRIRAGAEERTEAPRHQWRSD
ncbi:acyltransferase [Bradyrhizobium sp. 143]|nr:acyltransferase [Bradyrhizobium sp. 143]MCK1723903.1 acyltransferase [Bradyrhizobium sp. 142]